MAEVVVLPKPYVLQVGTNRADIIEVGLQGPSGPPGQPPDYYPAKTLVYGLDGVLNELLLYEDVDKLILAKRLVLVWGGGVLTNIETYSPQGTLLRDRALQYNVSGQLIGVRDG